MVKTDTLRGDVHKSATVLSNDPTSPSVTLEMTGKVITLVDVQPQDKFFLNTYRNEPQKKEITILNNDTKPLTIKKVENNNKNFTTELKTVQPGKEYKLQVTADTSQIGKSETVINVHTDHPKFAVIPISFSLQVRTLVGAFPTEVRFGNLKLDALKTAPGSITQRSVIVRRQKDSKEFKIEKATTDSPLFRVELEPLNVGQPGGYRVRIHLNMEKVKVGDSLDTVITVKTNDKETPELKIPIHGKVV